MIFRQITHDGLGCASYLVGDDGAGSAVVVGPRVEIDVYLDLARYMGVRIEHILEAHGCELALGDVARPDLAVDQICSTIGYERRHNALLGVTDIERVVQR